MSTRRVIFGLVTTVLCAFAMPTLVDGHPYGGRYLFIMTVISALALRDDAEKKYASRRDGRDQRQRARGDDRAGDGQGPAGHRRRDTGRVPADLDRGGLREDSGEDTGDTR